MSARLATRRVEKPWGREALPPPFDAKGERIGEIWFEPPPALDALLVKYLFTSDKLSVQVHPPGERGKEECWLVVDAEPGAVLGVGFDEDLGAAGDARRRARRFDRAFARLASGRGGRLHLSPTPARSTRSAAGSA